MLLVGNYIPGCFEDMLLEITIDPVFCSKMKIKVSLRRMIEA